MNIVITGAGSGIGYQLALLFASTFHNRIICLSRNVENLKKLHDEVYRKNPAARLMILETDLENPDEEKITNVIHDYQLEQIDILVNNAGCMINKPFEELTDADWVKTYAVNVMGSVKLIRILMPWLKNKSKRTHIINISSMGGVQGSVKFPGLSAYSSSKAALAVLTECLAEEFKDLNIAVNCLALGSVSTEMFQRAFPEFKAPVTADKMARFVYDFAITGPGYFNGKVIPVSMSTP